MDLKPYYQIKYIWDYLTPLSITDMEEFTCLLLDSAPSMQHTQMRSTFGNSSWCNRLLMYVDTDKPEVLILLCGQENGETWMCAAGELVGNYSHSRFSAGAARKPTQQPATL